MLEALCIAVRRGIDVSIITPKKSNHRLTDLVREGYLTRVQEVGAGIWFYEPRMLHAKAILVDDTVAITMKLPCVFLIRMRSHSSKPGYKS